MINYRAKLKILFAALTAITLSGVQFAAAQTMGPPPEIATAAVLPANEVWASARSAGFEPLGRPFLRGRVYWLHAIGPRGRDVALRIDAASGRILSVTPAGAPRVGYGGVAGYDAPGPYGRAYDPPPPPYGYGRGPYAYGPPGYGAPGGYDPPGYGPPGPQASGPQASGPPASGPQAYGPSAYGPRGPYGGEDEEMPTGTTSPSLPPRNAAATPARTPLPRPRPQTIASSSETAAPATPDSAPTQAAAPTPSDKKDANPQVPAAKPSNSLPPVTPLD